MTMRDMILAVLRIKGQMGVAEIATELGARRGHVQTNIERMLHVGIITSVSAESAKRDRKYGIVRGPFLKRPHAVEGSGQVAGPCISRSFRWGNGIKIF